MTAAEPSAALPSSVVNPFTSPSAESTKDASKETTADGPLAQAVDAVGKRLPHTLEDKHRFTVLRTDSNGPVIQEVVFAGNPRTYTSGTLYRVEYSPNPSEPNAVENVLCGEEDWTARHAVTRKAFVEAFGIEWWTQGEDIIAGATYAIRTKEGRCTISVSPAPPESRIPIDSSLKTTRILLSELVHIGSIAGEVDQVYYKGGVYACKFPSSDITYQDPLKEVKTAEKLKMSPYIIDVLGILTWDDAYRGFLMPYSPLGTLSDELKRRPYGWNERVQFAYDIVRGVQALHAIGAFNGDLKPENVLLMWTVEAEDRPRAQLIDLEANGGRTKDYTDPDVHPGWDQPTAVLDIYSVGRILQYLARSGDLDGPTPPYVPNWYTNVIERCLAPLDSRPDIGHVVDMFSQNLEICLRSTG